MLWYNYITDIFSTADMPNIFSCLPISKTFVFVVIFETFFLLLICTSFVSTHTYVLIPVVRLWEWKWLMQVFFFIFNESKNETTETTWQNDALNIKYKPSDNIFKQHKVMPFSLPLPKSTLSIVQLVRFAPSIGSVSATRHCGKLQFMSF